MDIKKLDKEIKKDGFVFELIKRTEKVCIYVQKLNDKIRKYEVSKVKVYDQHKMLKKFGKEFEGKEKFKEIWPKSEDFGYRAWTYSDLENATIKFEQLVQELS